MAEVLGNLFFANPRSIGGKSINDSTLATGSYLFSGAQSEGLTSYSGVLFVSGDNQGTQVRMAVGRDVLAYKRADGLWQKVNATTHTS